LTDVVARLVAAGCVAPEDEARELLRDAPDGAELEARLRRREAGEPLPWIVGSALDPYNQNWRKADFPIMGSHSLFMNTNLQFNTALNPRQVGVVHRALAPSDTELDWARRVLAADAASGGAAVQLDGRMVDLPVVLQARRTIARAAEAGART